MGEGRPSALTRRHAALTLAAALAVGPAIRAAAEEDGIAGLAGAIERRLGGRVGLAVLDPEAGRRWQHRGDERFPLCSTFKPLACAAVLARVDEGRESLARPVAVSVADVVAHSPVTGLVAGRGTLGLGALCEAAMTRSDNTAANLILAGLGGPAAVTAFARGIGDGATRLDRWETALNEAAPGDPRDTTTPNAMVATLAALLTGDRLSPGARERLAGWMVANRTGQRRLRAGLPRDWRVGDKTGSGGHGTANDIAVLWPPGRGPVFVAVYMTGGGAPPERRDAAFAELGGAVAEAVSGPVSGMPR